MSTPANPGESLAAVLSAEDTFGPGAQIRWSAGAGYYAATRVADGWVVGSAPSSPVNYWELLGLIRANPIGIEAVAWRPGPDAEWQPVWSCSCSHRPSATA